MISLFQIYLVKLIVIFAVYKSTYPYCPLTSPRGWNVIAQGTALTITHFIRYPYCFKFNAEGAEAQRRGVKA